jgi:hypothetical protein
MPAIFISAHVARVQKRRACTQAHSLNNCSSFSSRRSSVSTGRNPTSKRVESIPGSRQSGSPLTKDHGSASSSVPRTPNRESHARKDEDGGWGLFIDISDG